MYLLEATFQILLSRSDFREWGIFLDCLITKLKRRIALDFIVISILCALVTENITVYLHKYYSLSNAAVIRGKRISYTGSFRRLVDLPTYLPTSLVKIGLNKKVLSPFFSRCLTSPVVSHRLIISTMRSWLYVKMFNFRSQENRPYLVAHRDGSLLALGVWSFYGSIGWQFCAVYLFKQEYQEDDWLIS